MEKLRYGLYIPAGRAWVAVSFLLGMLFFVAPVLGAADDLSARHEALLSTQAAKLGASRRDMPELYVLTAGLSSRQDVFRNDVESMADLLGRHWGAAHTTLALVADKATKDTYAYPTRANLRRAAAAIRTKMDPAKDVFLLFLTSHGTTQGLLATVPDERPFTFSAIDIRKLLEESGARHRVVILSACHSGALMNEIKDERTLVMAAADADRTSFGCSFRHLHTWFTEALIEGLRETGRFEAAFAHAAKSIREREDGGEAWQHSNPQIFVGKDVPAFLQKVEARATSAAQWKPPVMETETGKVRSLLGDYLSVVRTNPTSIQAQWISLREVGPLADGMYPIKARVERMYSRWGAFEARFDPARKLLIAETSPIGRLALLATGQALVPDLEGRSNADAQPFGKTTLKAVAEARAKHPPRNLRAGAASKIQLVYLSAKDCSFCREWDKDHLSNGKLIAFPDAGDFDLVVSSRFSLRDPLRKRDLPDDLQPLFDKLSANSIYKRVIESTPSFLVLVDDQIRVFNVGAFLDSPVYPVLRAAIDEKRGR
jgi:hypothetical protein